MVVKNKSKVRTGRSSFRHIGRLLSEADLASRGERDMEFENKMAECDYLEANSQFYDRKKDRKYAQAVIDYYLDK